MLCHLIVNNHIKLYYIILYMHIYIYISIMTIITIIVLLFLFLFLLLLCQERLLSGNTDLGFREDKLAIPL